MQRDKDFKLAMVDVWTRLTTAYGNAFTSQYGDLEGQGFTDWSEALSHLSIERLLVGTANAAKLNQPFPPGLGEFMAICEASVQDQPAARRSDPRPSHAVAAIERAKQRALFGKPFAVCPTNGSNVADWSGDDEAALCDQVAKWDEESGLRGLCDLLDDYPFSSGTLNEKLGKGPGTRGGGRRLV